MAAYLRVAVRLEAEAASQEGLLAEVVGHDHEEEKRTAILIPTGVNECRL